MIINFLRLYYALNSCNEIRQKSSSLNNGRLIFTSLEPVDDDTNGICYFSYVVEGSTRLGRGDTILRGDGRRILSILPQESQLW